MNLILRLRVKVDDKFKLSKKKDDKSNKKAFNVYMEDETIKEIDKVARKVAIQEMN